MCLFSSCKKQSEEETGIFYIDKICPYTPIKDQGHSNSCWIYSMLATIESNRITIGDSLNLSPTLYERRMLEEEAERIYLNHGEGEIQDRGMIPHLLTMIEKYGALNYDTYHRCKSAKSLTVLKREIEVIAKTAAKQKKSLKNMRQAVSDHLNRELGHLPYVQYMYGVEYTYQQFARSIIRPGEYTVYCIKGDYPDRRPTDKYTISTQDEMFRLTLKSIEKGHAVCWEGDITKHNWTITDDHCMEIIGTAHRKDKRDNLNYFICKNSWGKKTANKGLRFMSYDDFKERTICIAVKTEDK